MSLFTPVDAVTNETPQPRRALIVVDTGESALAGALAEHGYATETASLTSAPWLVRTKSPDVIILELYQGKVGGNAEALYLARRLRAEPEVYETPIVIAYSEEQEALRSSSLYMGADDYFPLATTTECILARLDSLLWRKEAGRRRATLIGEQKLEIENFVLLTDAVRWDMERGWEGTLALVRPLNRESQGLISRAATSEALAAICGFLKLQMRSMDSVVFYDASTLMVYLPHLSTPMALGALTRLRGEFLEAQKSFDMAVGLISFPSDGNELEELLDLAETASLQARNSKDFRRVVAYGGSRTENNAPLTNQSEIIATEVEAEESNAETAPLITASSIGQEISIEQIESEYNDNMREAETPEDKYEVTRNLTKGEKPTLPLPEIAMPMTTEQGNVAVAPPVPLPPSPFTVAETYNSTKPELPTFVITEKAINPPMIGEKTATPGVASAQEIEQSLRPGQACRLLLAVSRPERMAQLNTLVRSAGYEVRPAFDGPHALGLLRIDQPDLLLLDYEVRGLNGLETLHRIQAQHSGRLPVPVILLADQPSPEIKAEAEALGVLKIINIPYSPIELLAAMRQAVSKS